MSVIVTEDGFGADTWSGGFATLEELEGRSALDLNVSDDPNELEGRLDDLAIIRVSFPSNADGRGFSQGQVLRHLGYTGRLRAVGPLMSDQFPMALAAGFDEVEIPDDLAARQPEHHWLTALSRYVGLSYQSRLRQSA